MADAASTMADTASTKAASPRSGIGKKLLIITGVVVAVALLMGIIKKEQVPERMAKVLAEDPDLLEFTNKMRSDERFSGAVDSLDKFINDLANNYVEYNSSIETPGDKLRATRTASMPVIVIPGITSSMLEIWEGRECAQYGFREKLWGSMQCAKYAVRNITCWLEHLGLTEDWDDPEGIKIRALEGLSAMDYMMPGYYVWGKVFENLGRVGYTTRNLRVFSYDWRLTPQDCELKDGLFTRIQREIEIVVTRAHKPAALMSHSMGGVMAHFFINWVEAKEGQEWLDKYLGAWVNIGGPLLGVAKAATCPLSADNRDTVDVNRFMGAFTSGTFNRQLQSFFKSLGSIPCMMPKGTDVAWKHSPNDGVTFPADIMKRLDDLWSTPKDEDDKDELRKKVEKAVSRNYTVPEIPDLLRILDPEYMEKVDKYYSLETTIASDTSDPRTWTNPFAKPLPLSGKSTVYCLYGHVPNVGTERGYRYTMNAYGDLIDALPVMLDANVNTEGLKSGVAYSGLGDSTVPLSSLAYPCLQLWKEGSPHNPRGAKVVTREYFNDMQYSATEAFAGGSFMEAARGGPKASTHIEILGNYEVIEDMLMLVTEPTTPGEDSDDDGVTERIYSQAYKLGTDQPFNHTVDLQPVIPGKADDVAVSGVAADADTADSDDEEEL